MRFRLRWRSFLRRPGEAVRRDDDEPAPPTPPAPKAICAPAIVSAAETTPPVPRVIAWRKCIERVLATDGYVVSASSEALSTGSSVRMWGTDQVFRIVGEASYEDALRQRRVYAEILGEELEPPLPASAHWLYFKFGATAPSSSARVSP